MKRLQHDVVNILYLISGTSESHLILAEEGRFEDLERRLRHAEAALRRNQEQAKRALSITKRIRHLIQSKDLSLQPNTRLRGSTRKAWDRAVARLKKEFLKHEVEMVAQLPTSFPVVHCDPDDLEEILYNLSKNSLQAMGLSGQLLLRGQLGTAENGKPLAILTLADTGTGISRDHMECLFQLYFTTKGRGNGLGLPLTKALVEKNRGRMTVASSPGTGTSFVIEFSAAA